MTLYRSAIVALIAWFCAAGLAVSAYATAIDDKYASLGGPGGFLGSPADIERTLPDGVGRFRPYQWGSIYWHPSLGAFEVHGAIRDEWAAMQWERGVLGYPTCDETPTPDGVGRYNHFQGGSIYWHPALGAHSIYGLVRDKWASIGWERSRLGYPTSRISELRSGSIKRCEFQNGSIVAVSRPDVRTAISDYPEVPVSGNDDLEIVASGCVQTGGSGRTWKRYVDPWTGYADLYRGTAFVPGVTTTPVALCALVGKRLRIPAGVNGHVRLGYLDDGYGDNGYDGHDDGTFDQCKNVNDALVLFTTTHLSQQAATSPFLVLAFGTSLTWGQGLLCRDKYSTRVVEWLRLGLPRHWIDLRVYAHSGAELVSGETAMAAGPEVPLSRPLIADQCDQARADLLRDGERLATVRLILMDGGINDVDVRNIINPLTTPATLSQLIQTACGERLRSALLHAAQVFPNATIVVLGYFPIITTSSDPAAVRAMTSGLHIQTPWSTIDRMVANSALWATNSNATIQSVVSELNQAAGTRGRLIFAVPRFGADNGLGGADAWLFGWPVPGANEDPAYGERLEQCASAGSNAPFFCLASSVGHPNVSGAIQYSRAIEDALSLKVRAWQAESNPQWLPPPPSAVFRRH